MTKEFKIDTVENAAATPDEQQPWAELGLKENEYDEIKKILGRRPTAGELAIYSVMWSEHASYKSSKIHLRQFGDKVTEKMKENMLVGIGQNAGVTDLGDGWAATYKIESHNSPSYIEPFQGAATGIGGIVRDIISMGARPVAVMDALRFGEIDHLDTKRMVHGAVSGLSHYGNTLGVPGIGGELVFDASYQGNPLVNALAVGVMRHEDIHLANASGVGNKVLLFGALTGADGIGGTSVLASESFDDSKEQERPTVQAGDPFMEKTVIDATLELFSGNLVEAIQDLGAAGISCATSELAANGGVGMHVELTNVVCRDEGMSPSEILMSESQERMMAIVTPSNAAAVEEILNKWNIHFCWLGEVTQERLIIDWNGETIVDVDPKTVADEGPVYDRPYARPSFQDEVQANTFRSAVTDLPQTGDQLKDAALQLMGAPNMCSKQWVTDQFDSYVQGNTAMGAPDDAGVIRVDETTNMGLAASTDCNARYVYLDPYVGSQLALAESYRNVATAGAIPVAVSDCLNYGSPENPDTMWQFVESIRALADGCLELEVPVTGGNVSLYNQTNGVDIFPTPVIGVLGKFDDVHRATPSGWQASADGAAIYLMGTTADELDGSEYAALHNHLGGQPPKVDLKQEVLLGDLLINASRDGMIDAAHDLSEGGLIATLSEMALRHNVGARITLDDVAERDGLDMFTLLFSESQGRAAVVVPRSEEVRFNDMCSARGYPIARIGIVDATTPELEIQGQFVLPLDELRSTWEAPLKKYFG